MKLLFITQKLHGQDAFGVLWVEALQKQGYDVTVLCLESRPEDVLRVLKRTTPLSFPVYSLGKERGKGKIAQIFTFLRLIHTLSYDRVFIHMSPVWGIFGAPVWMARRTPVYLWYTHYKMQLGLWMLGRYAKRLFCATSQSLPQYEGNPKKVVVGHGIDLTFWLKRENVSTDPKRLLVVHRLSRSKRVEIILRAMVLLPGFSLDVYGVEAESAYVQELKALVQELALGERVTFHGTVPLSELPALFTHHRLILNMASETIDKTMLEAMTCGCYPVVTARNAAAIGLRIDAERFGRQVGVPVAPKEDVPEAIADVVRLYAEKPPMNGEEMYRVVSERHSLANLITKMDRYIRPGE